MFSGIEEKMETGTVSDDDEKYEEDDGGEEAENKVRVCTDPGRPSKEAKERHDAMGHVQYRSWCPHCVKGRGQNEPHKSSERPESAIPLIGTDYFFAGENDDPTATMIGIKDSKSKAVHAYLVDNKGVFEHKVATKLAQWIDSLGYKRVAMKTDREASIVAVQEMVKQESKTEIVIENSPKGESQSNGLPEAAVRELSGMIRTLKDSIETKTGEKIEKKSAMMAWIVEHSGNMITRYRVGKDGRTAYQRLKGKAPSNKTLPLGEKVLYLPLKSAGKQNKLAPKFKYGIFVGVNPRTSESLIANSSGVFRARTVKRLPEDDRWDGNAISEIKGLPWDFRTAEAPEAEIRIEPTTEDIPPVPEIEIKVRKFYVMKQDIIDFGFTPGCSGCNAIARRLTTKPPHNEE